MGLVQNLVTHRTGLARCRSDQAEFGALLDGRPVVKSRGFGLIAAQNFDLRRGTISQVHCKKEFVKTFGSKY